ncbi:hypothetical protein ACIQNU_32880 [Streptomyces sp. NPDC091292]|uniref:hypothetical protein n=1 Tax=Streptomyces sp. NPDC091292 TaxID=3365991 RepID=UPI00380D3FC5
MPIFFTDLTDLTDDDGWETLHFDQADPSFYWNDGGKFEAAPVDIARTFDGAMWASARIEPAFKWRGRRIRPGFTLPKRHHNLPQLLIVVDGEITVETEDGKRTDRVGAGGFFTADAGTPYVLTAGLRGATYTECWDEPMSLVETTWHDDSHWVRR